MTLVAANKYQLYFENCPDFWRYTPCDGKVPINPETGSAKGNTDWPSRHYTLDQIIDIDPPSVGVLLGVTSKTVGVDVDGNDAEASFDNELGYKFDRLPPTLGVTSGRPGHYTLFFEIPEEYIYKLENYTCKKPGHGNCELRYNNEQSVVYGRHPNNKIGDRKVNYGQGDGTGHYLWRKTHHKGNDNLGVSMLPYKVCERWAKLIEPPAIPPIKKFKLTNPDLIEDIRLAKDYLDRFFQPANEWSEYWDWIYRGMELHELSSRIGDDWKCFEIWDNWSSLMNNYDHDECRRKWFSFINSKSPRSRKFKSLVWAAQQHDDFDGPVAKEEEPEKTYTELIELIYQSALVKDQNQKYKYLAELATKFKRYEKDIRPELLDYMRKQYSNKTYTVGECDISKVKDLDYLLEGFIPQGEVTHLFGEWASGKTSLALGMIRAGANGESFLDQDIKHEPFKSLFIQSDATASRFKAAYHELSMDQDPRFFRPGPNQMSYLWAPDAEQGLTGWQADLWGLMKLMQEVPTLGVKAIFIDSVKGMMGSGDNFAYTDNIVVGNMVKLLRENIAQQFNVAVVLLNHRGKDENQGAGAKQWTEASGQAIELKNVKEFKQVVNDKRELVVAKDSITGKRRFQYSLKDGKHIVVDDGGKVKNSFDYVKDNLVNEWTVNSKKVWKREELLQMKGISRTSVDRIIKKMTEPNGVLKKNKPGVFELRPNNL